MWSGAEGRMEEEEVELVGLINTKKRKKKATLGLLMVWQGGGVLPTDRILQDLVESKQRLNVKSCGERYAMGGSDVEDRGGATCTSQILSFMCEQRRLNVKKFDV